MIPLSILEKTIDACLIGFAAFSMFSISLTQLCVGVGVVGWLIRVQMTRSWNELDLPLGRVFFIFVVACVLAVVTSVAPVKSAGMLKKTLLVAIFFWVINVLKNETQKELLLKILLISACLAALYGISQAIALGVSISTRVEGTMSIYMTFAGVIMLAVLMASGRFLFHLPREKWIGVVIIFLGVCLLLTLTRQAWLGTLAGLFFLLWVFRRTYLIVLPAILVLVLVVGPASVKHRLLSVVNFKDETFLIRVQLWQAGWQIFKDYPFTGCGFKCVDSVYPQYPEHAAVLSKYKGMHNNLLQVAVDTGLLGLSAWLSIWICFFLVMYKTSIAGKGNSQRWIILGSTSAVIGFLAGGIFEVNFYDSEVVMLLYFLMALPFSRRQANTPDD